MILEVVENGPQAGATDRDLVARYRDGEIEAFSELYERHAGPLLLYAHSLSRDAALGEDLVQECFVRAMRLDPGRLDESIRSLLYATLRNLLRDELRKSRVRRKTRPLLAPAEEADPLGPSPEDMILLSEALDRLPDDQREVIILKFHAGLTFAQIAEVTGRSEPTVKSRYRYALQKLADWIPQS